MGLSHPLAGKTMAEVGKAKWSLPNSILVHFDITINNTWFKNETFGQMFNLTGSQDNRCNLALSQRSQGVKSP